MQVHSLGKLRLAAGHPNVTSATRHLPSLLLLVGGSERGRAAGHGRGSEDVGDDHAPEPPERRRECVVVPWLPEHLDGARPHGHSLDLAGLRQLSHRRGACTTRFRVGEVEVLHQDWIEGLAADQAPVVLLTGGVGQEVVEDVRVLLHPVSRASGPVPRMRFAEVVSPASPATGRVTSVPCTRNCVV